MGAKQYQQGRKFINSIDVKLTYYFKSHRKYKKYKKKKAFALYGCVFYLLLQRERTINYKEVNESAIHLDYLLIKYFSV